MTSSTLCVVLVLVVLTLVDHCSTDRSLMLFGAYFQTCGYKDLPFKLTCLVTEAEGLSDWVKFILPLSGVSAIRGEFDNLAECQPRSDNRNYIPVCGAGTENNRSHVKEYHLWIKRFTEVDTRQPWQCRLLNGEIFSNRLNLNIESVPKHSAASGAWRTSLPVFSDVIIAEVFVLMVFQWPI